MIHVDHKTEDELIIEQDNDGRTQEEWSILNNDCAGNLVNQNTC